MKNLFVGNLSFQTTEGELQALFEQFGETTRVQIMTDRDTGRSRGFGFVEMSSDEAATKAIEALNGKELGGRALNVNEARPKPEGGRSGGGGGRGFGGGGGGGRGGYGRDDYRGGGGGGGGGGRGPRREPRW